MSRGRPCIDLSSVSSKYRRVESVPLWSTNVWFSRTIIGTRHTSLVLAFLPYFLSIILFRTIGEKTVTILFTPGSSLPLDKHLLFSTLIKFNTTCQVFAFVIKHKGLFFGRLAPGARSSYPPLPGSPGYGRITFYNNHATKPIDPYNTRNICEHRTVIIMVHCFYLPDLYIVFNRCKLAIENIK